MTATTEMTYEELRCALEIATENRRVLAQAVLDMETLANDEEVGHAEWMAAYNRMLSLAQELVK